MASSMSASVRPYSPSCERLKVATNCFWYPPKFATSATPGTRLRRRVTTQRAAAAHGGTTSALSFTGPAAGERDLDCLLRSRSELERGGAVVDVGLHAAIYDPDHVTHDDLAAAKRAGAAAIKIFLAYPELGIMCSTRRLYELMRAARELGLPGRDRMVRRIVKRVFPRETGGVVLGAVQRCVAQLDGLIGRRPNGQARLDARELQTVVIRCAPDVGRRRADVIDIVPLTPMEQSHIGLHASAAVPLDGRIVTPRSFRFQIRRSDIRRIVIVEIGVAGQAERPPGRRTHAPLPSEPYAERGSGIELARAAVKKFLARA
jgi:hypothetical protein